MFSRRLVQSQFNQLLCYFFSVILLSASQMKVQKLIFAPNWWCQSLHGHSECTCTKSKYWRHLTCPSCQSNDMQYTQSSDFLYSFLRISWLKWIEFSGRNWFGIDTIHKVSVIDFHMQQKSHWEISCNRSYIKKFHDCSQDAFHWFCFFRTDKQVLYHHVPIIKSFKALLDVVKKWLYLQCIISITTLHFEG